MWFIKGDFFRIGSAFTGHLKVGLMPLPSMRTKGQDLLWHLAWQMHLYREMCIFIKDEVSALAAFLSHSIFSLEAPQDISGLSVFEMVIGRTTEEDWAHSEEKAVGGKDFFRRKYNTLQKLSALHLIRQANRQEKSKEKAQWRQKRCIMTRKPELLTISLVINYYSIANAVSWRMWVLW